jgi:hypothetical protein
VAPESGTRTGDNGSQHRRDSKIQMAVDILGHLLALHVTAAHAHARSGVTTLAAQAYVIF